MIKLVVKTFDELSKEELYGLLKLRGDTFCFEQECVYQEFDGLDQGETMHLLAIKGDEVVGNIRLVPKDGQIILGRVALKPEFRGTGMGRRMMNEAMKMSGERYPTLDIYITAQAHLEDYYASFGFIKEGEVFYYPKDRIPHVPMRLKAAA